MATYTTMRNLTTGDLVTESDMDALRGNIEYLLDPNKEIIKDENGPYTTTSTAFVAVSSNLSITLTTNGGPVLLGVMLHSYDNGTDSAHYYDIAVDSVREGGNNGLAVYNNPGNAVGFGFPFTFTHITDTLTPGSHTFELQFKTGVSDNIALAASADYPAIMWAVEI